VVRTRGFGAVQNRKVVAMRRAKKR